MEFSIDIHTTLNGEIRIKDYSRDYGQYIGESVEEVLITYDYYKYSQSVTLNSLTKVNVDGSKLLTSVFTEHSLTTDEECTFKVLKDGYYIIDHIVLPTLEWLEEASEDYKNYYGTIYVSDGEKIFKVIEDKLEECSIEEVLERNIEGTTIKKCKIDVFYTGHLQNCYINYCKKLFDSLLNICRSGQEDTFARDFIWMTLNIIDYLIGFKQFMEAERLLSMFQTCGGFCNNEHNKKGNYCGCS